MEELICREGTVHSVIFQNAENGYTVLRLLTEEGEIVTVVGCIPCVAPGEHLTVTGTWETHPQHGEQLRAEELERSLPEEEDEILAYLSSGICKGVGPATARSIVERFGLDTLDILETEPERLQMIRGITAKKAMEIGAMFRQHMGLRRLMEFLSRYQLPPVLAIRLRQQYGDGALEMVRRNPYLLSDDVCGVDFSVTDTMALSMGFAEDCGERLRAAVTFELTFNENNGHVFLPRDKLLSATCQLLDCGLEQVEAALDALTEQHAVVIEHIANVQAVYLRRLWEAESSACARLLALLDMDADQSRYAERTVAEIEREQGITYAPMQRQAVALAAKAGVMLLTGGPGTVNLNRLLQDALNPKAPGKRELTWGERVFRVGDRIMQTRNDYDVMWEKDDGTVGTGLFNGDVGRIADIDAGGEWLALDFDGRKALYSVEMLSEIDLAYAQTVHKAQGSEYRCVVLAAMPAAPGLMVRGVLYTALTRARELLVIVGDDAAIRSMAANDKRQKRYSGLKWRLCHAGDEAGQSE